MKAAMWGIGLIVVGILGIVLVNLFGNITVTNQFNYTTMKNAVQAAMLDSLDIAHYRAGFCLCTTDGSAINTESKRSFTDKSEYEFRDIVNDKCVNQYNETMNNCTILYGEYRLDPDKFEKTFQERFETVKNNNKTYEYEIKEIIEYPPKVSVRVISHDEELLPTDKGDGYNIVNQLDAIIETNGEINIEISKDDPIACYKNGDKYERGTQSSHIGWEKVDDSNCDPVENETPSDTPNHSSGGSSCGWHYEKTSGNCYVTSQAADQYVNPDASCPTNCNSTGTYTTYNGQTKKKCTGCKTTTQSYVYSDATANGSFSSRSAAENDCVSNLGNSCSGRLTSNSCTGVRTWKLTHQSSGQKWSEEINSDNEPACSDCVDGTPICLG